MEIEEINIRGVSVPEIPIVNPNVSTPLVPWAPPVTVNIGSPIVDMPGCVEAHPEDKGKSPSLPKEDPDGTVTLCDGQYPSYDAMDYQPEQLVIQRDVPPPEVEPPPEVDPPPIPDTGNVGGEKEVECPAPNQPRVGDLTQNGDERVIGHEVQNGQCVVLYESTTAVEKFLPSTNQVSTTAAIAVVATAAAAATPLLLRVIKPVIKKLTTTVQKKLGKKVTPPTRAEIQTNEYRAKKGLPPLKKK
jgi:hypothetical protein